MVGGVVRLWNEVGLRRSLTPSGRILGAHVLGPQADDVINIFAMAMRTGGTASPLKEILFAYPTAGSDIPYMV
jgi:glutathione reductase (NADPH)